MAFIPHGHPKREENFRQWFGKSKLVDKGGNPLVLYHGTDKDFSAFDTEKHGESDHGWYGVGHYLTVHPAYAAAYAEQRSFPDDIKGNVMPVHARLENPYVWPKDRPVADTLEEAKQLTEELIRKGHDGVIAPNYHEEGPYSSHYEVVAFHPEQIKSATGNQGTFDPNDPDITKAEGGEVEDDGITAYHGSPHDYPAERLIRSPEGQEQYIVGQPGALPEVPQGATVMQDFPLGRMRMDKIGTGEGAQAYGHGLYTAEAEPVAKGYRDQLSLKKNQMSLVDKTTGEPLTEDVPGHRPIRDFFETYAYDLRDGDRKHRMEQWDSWKEDAARQLKDWENFRSHPDYANPETAKWAEEQMDGFRKQIADYDAAQKLLPNITAKPVGHMYEVRINAHPDHFLDWDKPLSEQSQYVQEQLKGYLRNLGGKKGSDFYSQAGLNPSETSRLLLTKGIKGIKYLDAQSRGAGEGSRNYVVFDDKLVNVKRKYAAGGVVKESSDGKEARKDRNPHHGRQGRKTPLIIDQYPTRYMPHVGRQVMQTGGSAIVKHALELTSRSRQRGR